MGDLHAIPNHAEPAEWTWRERVQAFRDVFAAELDRQGVRDELAAFAAAVGLLGEPARLVASLDVGLGLEREWTVRRQAAMGLQEAAAGLIEVSERLLEPGA